MYNNTMKQKFINNGKEVPIRYVMVHIDGLRVKTTKINNMIWQK